MARTRYREERILARGLCRLPGQSRAEFKQNAVRLRRHFEQFNLDVSEICQWVMALRPGGKLNQPSASKFWEFFLSPEKILGEQPDDVEVGYWRLEAFHIVAGWETDSTRTFPGAISASFREVSQLPRSTSADRLFARLKGLNRSHRMILLKSAADWIVGHYLKDQDNQKVQYGHWIAEKNEWENAHPELTAKVRSIYNEIFKKVGIVNKKPRVCEWSRLREGKYDCQWAGERIRSGGKWKSHSALCKKYFEFASQTPRMRKKFFFQNAEDYLAIRKSLPKDRAISRFMTDNPQGGHWFPAVWDQYLQALNLSETTILNQYQGKLPHCTKADDDCSFNVHTNDCRQYKLLLHELTPELQELEPLYREWRRSYLAGPEKPSFRYPSARLLPTPKVFGTGYYQLDFENSVLQLRLDDMSVGEYLSLGFKPWPIDYDIQPEITNISSVQLHFIGTRARAGFRFRISYQASRLAISQDEINEIRSKRFPRRSQDQQFLDEIRPRILGSFKSETDREPRVLAVDLGSTGGGAAIFEGRDFQKYLPLRIIKMEKLYDSPPQPAAKDKRAREEKEIDRRKGLNQYHVGSHLEAYSEWTGKIAATRPGAILQLGDHDLRRLTKHVLWMIRDWVRLNASQIIQVAENEKVDLIVLESMRGFRAPGYDKLDEQKKRRIAFFAYGKIRHKLTEKAVERGMRVVTVPYFRSSQVCSKCGEIQADENRWKSNKMEHRFVCESEGCGYSVNSDLNAAAVVGRVFWGDIQLPISPLNS